MAGEAGNIDRALLLFVFLFGCCLQRTNYHNIEPPLVSFVRQLHDALNKEENFEVVLHDNESSSGASLKLLAQPFKLRLAYQATGRRQCTPLDAF